MLTRRTLDQPRPIVTVDAAIGQGLGPHKERFHSYLGVVAREKVPIVHNNWKDVPDTLKELVWNDILVSAVLVTYKVKKILNFYFDAYSSKQFVLQAKFDIPTTIIKHKHPSNPAF